MEGHDSHVPVVWKYTFPAMQGVHVVSLEPEHPGDTKLRSVRAGQPEHAVHSRLVLTVHAVVSKVLPVQPAVHAVHPRLVVPLHAFDSNVEPAMHVAQAEQTRFVLDVHAVVWYVIPFVHVAQFAQRAGM